MPSGYYEFFSDEISTNGELIYREATLTNLDLSFSGSYLRTVCNTSDNGYVPTQLNLNFLYAHYDDASFDGYVELYFKNELIGSVFMPYSVAGEVDKTFDLSDSEIFTMQARKSTLELETGSWDTIEERIRSPYFDIRFNNFGTSDARVVIDDLSISYNAASTPTYQNYETFTNPELVEGHFGVVDGTVISSGSPYRYGQNETIKVNFSGYENLGFDKVGKATVRINASNASEAISTDPASRTRLEVFGYNRHINKIGNDRLRVFAWGQTEPILNSGFQSYDVELSFINRSMITASGFAAFKEDRDWMSLFAEGDFYIAGGMSGLEISDGYLYLENYNDKYLPLHSLGGNGLVDGVTTVYPSGRATGFNLLKDSIDYDHYFNEEYFGFNNLSPLSNDGTNQIVEISSVTDGYTATDTEHTPNIINYFSSNLDRANYAENNLVKTSTDTELRVLSGIDLSGDYSLIFHGFTPSVGKVLSTSHLELERLSNEIILKIKTVIEGGWYDQYINIYGSEDELSLLIEKTGNDYAIRSLNGDKLSAGGSGYTNLVSLEVGPSIDPPQNYLSLFSGITGTLCQLGVSTSGWSTEDRTNYTNSIYSFAEYLNNGSGVSVEVPASTNMNTIPFDIGSDVPLEDRDNFFRELNLPHRIDFYSVDNNTSGFYLDLETDSPVDMIYSGYFRYGTNGYLRFIGDVASGTGTNTRIYADDSYYEKFARNEVDFRLESKLIIDQPSPYSGTVSLYNTSMGLSSWSSAVEIASGIDLYMETAEESEKEIDLYVRGISASNSGLDMYTYGSYYSTEDVNFYTYGISDNVESINLYVRNILRKAKTIDFSMSGHPYTEEEDLTLFTFGAYIPTSGLDFHTYGVNEESTDLPFYTAGLSPTETVSGLEFYSAGSAAPNSVESVDFHLYSNMDRDNSINLFVRGNTDTDTSSVDFVLAADAFVNKSFDLYMENTREDETESLDFYLGVPMSGVEESINLYIGPGETMHLEVKPIEFSLKVNDREVEPVNFVIDGALVDSEPVNLFISGIGTDTSSIQLYSHGF